MFPAREPPRDFFFVERRPALAAAETAEPESAATASGSIGPAAGASIPAPAACSSELAIATALSSCSLAATTAGAAEDLRDFFLAGLLTAVPLTLTTSSDGLTGSLTR